MQWLGKNSEKQCQYGTHTWNNTFPLNFYILLFKHGNVNNVNQLEEISAVRCSGTYLRSFKVCHLFIVYGAYR